MAMNFSNLALQVPQILLPNPQVDLSRWAVIACDQYTSEPAYWQEVESLVDEHPSTLRLVFPEVYLEETPAETAGRIASINRTMQQYLADGTLRPLDPGFVLVDRKTAHVPSRKGLVVALDLEEYDYRAGANTLIRATEGTIVDRLPPRVRVRENASIELPHIMVLIDDPECTVIEPLFDRDLPQLYDFELMQDGGHLSGWHVAGEALIAQVADRLAQLVDPERFRRRYDEAEGDVMLYAMGDGNHSFATAKAIWETLKAEADDQADLMKHPARYALVELVNVHDPGLEFEAIHRVVFDVDVDAMAAAAQDFYTAADTPCQWRWLPDAGTVEAERAATPAGSHAIPLVAGDRHGLLTVADPAYTLVVATLQAFLDDFLQKQTGARIDYIHGDAAVVRLAGESRAVGFSLPAISKQDLFRTIVKDGALPRKTFSMGEADEKRFYLEARRITP